MNAPFLRQALAGLPISEIRAYPQTGSTNTDALRWVESGAPDGALVVADEQTAGRGRLDRQWVTRAGTALAFSLVLRPRPAEMPQVGLFSALGGLAVAQALENLGLAPQIKWPNDVLVGGKKVCGILLESNWLGEQLAALVIGIGVNVLRGSVPEAGLLFPAASLEELLGQPLAREALLRDILAALYGWRSRLGSPEFMQAWESRLAYRAEWVQIERAEGEPVTGVVVGIDAGGGLRLRLASDEEVIIYAGDVRLRPANNTPTAHLGE